MDIALKLIESGRAQDGVVRLVNVLRTLRRTMPRPDWERYAREVVRQHAVTRYLYADPLTQRAFVKPRGYAGDAVMMDYLYGRAGTSADLEPAVAGIFSYNAGPSASACAVRYRRQALAREIDAVASTLTRRADVLALAAGHLRELELSASARAGSVAVTAIDQDPASLEVVAHEYRSLGASPVQGSVRQILAGKLRLPTVDLAYSAGLYDYLTGPVAERLTARLFDAVRPGGVLLVANFLPDISDVGYMEAVMDWHLIYRSDAEMLALVSPLPQDQLGRVEQFHDPGDNITFLRVTKTLHVERRTPAA